MRGIAYLLTYSKLLTVKTTHSLFKDMHDERRTHAILEILEMAAGMKVGNEE